MDSTTKTTKTRAGSKAIILMEDENFLYGVYDAGELYPARWLKTGHFMPQEEGKPEYKTALDIAV